MDPQTAQQPTQAPQPTGFTAQSAPQKSSKPPSKNILLVIGVVLVLIVVIFIFLILGKQKQSNLTSLPQTPSSTNTSPVANSTPSAPPTSQVYGATLALTPNPLTLSSNQTGSINVVLDTAVENATAVQLEISYDPAVLSNVDITPGTFFTNPTVLLKKVDQTQGKISYAISAALTDKGKQGKGTVATITFAAQGQTGKTSPVAFLPKTLATAQGAQTTILKTLTSTSIVLK